MLILKKKTKTKLENIHMRADVNDFLKDSLLDLILQKEYKYETLKFGLIRECRTKKGYLKTIMKIMEYKYNSIYNDVLAKQYNGLKTIITRNTQMHKIFLKVERAKPLSSFGLRFKKSRTLIPKMKEYFNLTGYTTGYVSFLFLENRQYEYMPNLLSIIEARNHMLFSTRNALRTNINNYIQILRIKQSYKKRRFKLRIGGFKLRLRNRARIIRIRYVKNKTKRKIRTFTRKKRRIFMRNYFRYFFNNIRIVKYKRYLLKKCSIRSYKRSYKKNKYIFKKIKYRNLYKVRRYRKFKKYKLLFRSYLRKLKKLKKIMTIVLEKHRTKHIPNQLQMIIKYKVYRLKKFLKKKSWNRGTWRRRYKMKRLFRKKIKILRRLLYYPFRIKLKKNYGIQYITR